MTVQDAFELALQHHKSGRLAEAEKLYWNILEAQPDYAEALHMLGLVAHQNRHHVAAAEIMQKGIALTPEDPGAHANLSDVLRCLGRFDEAVAAGQRAIELRPDFANAHNNLGNVFKDVGRVDEAIAAYRRTLELIPDDPEARWNLSLLLLLHGDLERGWPLYEARWETEARRPSRRDFAQPMWDGRALEGRTLLIHAEQGLGDSLQFIRYARQAAAAGGLVIVECQRSLARLFADVEGVSKVVASGDPLPSFDLHVPMLSLPLVFRTTLETIPGHAPYLAVSPGHGEAWRQWLGGDGPHLKVGLVWAGRATTFQQNMRALRLEQLFPLLEMPGVEFVSLQVDKRGGELLENPISSSIRDPRPRIADFADTAALISQLDLVISIDTAVAHLAGALGKPTWVLLPFAADWRWLLGRSESPWYPATRLFRQPRLMEWEPVIAGVREELQSLIQARA